MFTERVREKTVASHLRTADKALDVCLKVFEDQLGVKNINRGRLYKFSDHRELPLVAAVVAIGWSNIDRLKSEPGFLKREARKIAFALEDAASSDGAVIMIKERLTVSGIDGEVFDEVYGSLCKAKRKSDIGIVGYGAKIRKEKERALKSNGFATSETVDGLVAMGELTEATAVYSNGHKQKKVAGFTIPQETVVENSVGRETLEPLRLENLKEVERKQEMLAGVEAEVLTLQTPEGVLFEVVLNDQHIVDKDRGREIFGKKEILVDGDLMSAFGLAQFLCGCGYDRFTAMKIANYALITGDFDRDYADGRVVEKMSLELDKRIKELSVFVGKRNKRNPRQVGMFSFGLLEGKKDADKKSRFNDHVKAAISPSLSVVSQDGSGQTEAGQPVGIIDRSSEFIKPVEEPFAIKDYYAREDNTVALSDIDFSGENILSHQSPIVGIDQTKNDGWPSLIGAPVYKEACEILIDAALKLSRFGTIYEGHLLFLEKLARPFVTEKISREGFTRLIEGHLVGQRDVGLINNIGLYLVREENGKEAISEPKRLTLGLEKTGLKVFLSGVEQDRYVEKIAQDEIFLGAYTIVPSNDKLAGIPVHSKLKTITDRTYKVLNELGELKDFSQNKIVLGDLTTLSISVGGVEMPITRSDYDLAGSISKRYYLATGDYGGSVLVGNLLFAKLLSVNDVKKVEEYDLHLMIDEIELSHSGTSLGKGVVLGLGRDMLEERRIFDNEFDAQLLDSSNNNQWKHKSREPLNIVGPVKEGFQIFGLGLEGLTIYPIKQVSKWLKLRLIRAKTKLGARFKKNF